jgi:hypothetical protein
MKTLVGGSTATQVSLHICGDRKEDEIKPGKEFSKAQIEEAKLGKVRANEGDAWCVVEAGFFGPVLVHEDAGWGQHGNSSQPTYMRGQEGRV